MQISHEEVKAIMIHRPDLDGIIWVHKNIHGVRKNHRVSEAVNAIGALVSALEKLHGADIENGNTKLADLFQKHCDNHGEMDPWSTTDAGGTHKCLAKISKTVGLVHKHCEKALKEEPGIQALKDEMLAEFTIDFKAALPTPEKDEVDALLGLLKDLQPEMDQD